MIRSFFLELKEAFGTRALIALGLSQVVWGSCSFGAAWLPSAQILVEALTVLAAGGLLYAAGGARLAGLGAGLFSLMAFAGGAVRGETDYLLYAVAAVVMVCGLIRLLSFSRWLQGIVYSLGFVVFVLAEAVMGSYQKVTGHELGQMQMVALADTTGAEAWGYLQAHPVFLPLLGLVLAAFLLLPLLFLTKRKPRLSVQDYALSWIVANVALMALLQTQTFGFDRTLKLSMAHQIMMTERAFKTVAVERKAHSDQIGATRRPDFQKAVYVVVIGESANRHHLHLYGYPRDTTPLMDARRAQLAVFDQAISSYSATVYSLRRALTLATVESGETYADPGRYSMIEILRSAGFKTYWISNQPRWGVWGYGTSLLASAADVQYFHQETPDAAKVDALKLNGRKTISEHTIVEEGSRIINKLDFDGLFNGYDTEMLPKITESLAAEEGPAVLFVHIMGSHLPYQYRTPPDKVFFSPKERTGYFGPKVCEPCVNVYDNSIRTTDFVLDRIMAALEAKQIPTSLLYFSDHGESILLARQHDPSDFTTGHVDVPLFLWFSPAYQRAYPELVALAQRQAHQPFMLDSLTQLVMDWTRVTGPFYKAESSLLNAAYAPKPRMTQDGAVDYDALTASYCSVVRQKTGFSLGNCPQDTLK